MFFCVCGCVYTAVVDFGNEQTDVPVTAPGFDEVGTWRRRHGREDNLNVNAHVLFSVFRGDGAGAAVDLEGLALDHQFLHFTRVMKEGFVGVIVRLLHFLAIGDRHPYPTSSLRDGAELLRLFESG
jgi:hypothetical protein